MNTDKGIVITGFRGSTTGMSRHAFYRDNERVCEAFVPVLPSPTVLIEGDGYKLLSPFDMQSTIVRGLTRYVLDRDSENEVFRIVYRAAGSYEMVCGELHITVRADAEGASFSVDGRPAAWTEPIFEFPWAPEMPGYDVAPCFGTVLYADLNPLCTLAVLTFPILRFAI